MKPRARILIADDHALIRKGLRMSIEADPTFEVVGEAPNGNKALAMIAELQPRIAILDVNMPEMTGFEVAQEVRRQRLDIAIIFLTMHKDRSFFNKAMDVGAKGYVLKDGALEEIVSALHSVLRGNAYISPELSGHLLQRLDRAGLLAQKTPRLNDLTATEKRILKMIAEYKTSKEIAEELHIHYRTVDNHRTNIAGKLGLHGSHSLLKFAVEHHADLA